MKLRFNFNQVWFNNRMYFISTDWS